MPPHFAKPRVVKPRRRGSESEVVLGQHGGGETGLDEGEDSVREVERCTHA